MSLFMNMFQPTTCSLCGAWFDSLNGLGLHMGAHFPPTPWQFTETRVAQKCPVCAGAGQITKPATNTSNPWPSTCHGCGGKGWVSA